MQPWHAPTGGIRSNQLRGRCSHRYDRYFNSLDPYLHKRVPGAELLVSPRYCSCASEQASGAFLPIAKRPVSPTGGSQSGTWSRDQWRLRTQNRPGKPPWRRRPPVAGTALRVSVQVAHLTGKRIWWWRYGGIPVNAKMPFIPGAESGNSARR